MTALQRIRLGVFLTLSSAACAPVANTVGPFGAPAARIGNHFYRVRLEVVCDQCFISYSIGSEAHTAQPTRGNQVWSVTLVRSPTSTEDVRLTATSPANGSTVRSVRIFVDGDLAASDENASSEPRRTLSVHATIPPPDRTRPSRAEASDGFANGNKGPFGSQGAQGSPAEDPACVKGALP